MTGIQLVGLKFMYQFYLDNDQLPPLTAMQHHFKYAGSSGPLPIIRALAKLNLIEKNSVRRWKFTQAGLDAVKGKL